MSRAAAAVLVAASVCGGGCGYLGNRILDLGDILRVEPSVGVGLQVHVAATEIAHVGFGSSRRYAAGYRYGEFLAERREEDHLPLSYLRTLADPRRESLHSLRWGPDAGKAPQHRCFAALPAELNRSLLEKDPIHYFDIEVGVMAGIAGIEAGFSIGELADFLAGLLGFDLAGDDGPENRERKRYWRPVPVPPPPAPKR